MSLGRVKNWIVNDILTASDLNAEFNNILNNASTLITPITADLSMNTKRIDFDADTDTSIRSDADDVLIVELQGSDRFIFDGDVVSPVNGLTFVVSATNNPVQVLVNGTDDDIGITFDAKNGEEMLTLAAVVDAKNEITITSAAAGAEPIISATGDDTDIGITLTPKGAGVVALTGNLDFNGNSITDGGGLELITFTEDGSAVNHINIENQATGAATSGPFIRPAGSDTDVALNLLGKGTGKVQIGDASIAYPDADGAANTILKTDGAATAAFAAATYAAGPATTSLLPYPRGHLAGMQITHTSTTLIDVGKGSCRCGTSADPDLANAINTNAAFGKTFVTGGWVAGDGNSGVPTAAGFAAAADTWHYFALVGSDGTQDFGYDTSVTAVNLLADAAVQSALTATVYYRRIASFVSDATPVLTALTQIGDEFVWAVVVDEGPTAPDGTAQTLALTVPTDVNVEAIFNVLFEDNTIDATLSIHRLDGDTSAPSKDNALANFIGPGGNDAVCQQMRMMTDTSSSVGYRSSEAIALWEVGTVGWVDSRGRYD